MYVSHVGFPKLWENKMPSYPKLKDYKIKCFALCPASSKPPLLVQRKVLTCQDSDRTETGKENFINEVWSLTYYDPYL